MCVLVVMARKYSNDDDDWRSVTEAYIMEDSIYDTVIDQEYNRWVDETIPRPHEEYEVTKGDTSGDIVHDEATEYYRRFDVETTDPDEFVDAKMRDELDEPTEPYQFMQVTYTQQLTQPSFVTNFRERDDAFKTEIGRNLCRVVKIEITASNPYGRFNELFPKEEKNYGGYKKDILTENLTEREKASFICTVCEGIMKDACISNLEEQFCSCCNPCCRNSYHTKIPDVSVRKMINSLKCSCPLSERGCKWSGSLKDCENHLDTCGYVYEKCKLECGVELTRNELRIHEKEKCLNRIVKCEHCVKDFKSCELNEHLEKCPKMEVSCNLKCGLVMCREDMELHLKRHCGMVQEKCKLRCRVVLTRNELRIHEKEKCPNRMVKCEHCQKGFKSRQMNEHLEKCPKMKVSCDLKCGLVMCREEMEQHLKRHCGMVRETCRLGCGVELTRNELRIHVKEKCPNRIVKCEHCQKDFKSCELDGHFEKCPKMKVSCNLKCGLVMCREEMEQHLKRHCGMVRETCRLGCGVELTRNELRIHVKEKCVQRLIQCEHCSISVRFCGKPKHLKQCPRVIVPCELCSVETRRDDMTKHLSEDCKEKEVECPFIKYKCMTRIKRKDMDKHLEENETKHLGLKLTVMEDLITKQSEKINEQSVEIRKQSEENTQLHEKQNIQFQLLHSITDVTTLSWKVENVPIRGRGFSDSRQYQVAGYSFIFKLIQSGEVRIVFPATTIKYVNPFKARFHIALSADKTINCGIIEVEQNYLTRGCERILTYISQEDVEQYSKPAT